ncbi:CubicO group peptidase (beta-lactamase class C family) [Inhella inkyongensis]|uniref:CubicO group peptidase (Beta-lactamase class C family) n=1 Tax=Inhella inkyongensis TaxID=392593 RepID=A0A840S8X6_9BURK|nr:serine hydrolase domain-containing protein [Inhella inkyongensis]MBB5205978.1 CubicO group peptidase (beta-lactamase class C family) [Inhella inkyongensis]
MPADLSLPRRALFTLSLLALLSACGGGVDTQRDEIRDPQLLTETQAARTEAETAVRTGLVGAVFATQAESAAKLYLGTAGLRKPQGAAMQGDEAFHLASMSKSMTAALAAHWVEKGRLRWDSKPAELLPELATGMHPAYAQITLAQLLNHRAGLVALDGAADIAAFAQFLATQTEPLPQTEAGRRRVLARWTLSLPPAGQPGQDFVYSNAGYTLVGAMLEAATGQDFETLMRQFLAPMNLHPLWQPASSTVQGHEGEHPSRLQPFSGFGAEMQPWVDAIKPSGDVWLTPAEYGLWLAEHQRALQGKAHALPAFYVQTLRTLRFSDYALGWQGGALNGRPYLVHAGAASGFMGAVILRQDGQRAHFALTNTFGTDAATPDWVTRALNDGLIRLASR